MTWLEQLPLSFSMPVFELMVVGFLVGVLGGVMGLVLGSFRLAMLVSIISDPLRLASTNIIINTMVGGVTAIENWRLKRVRYREFFFIGIFTWGGALLGSLTSRFLPQNILFFILGSMLCLSGLMMAHSLWKSRLRRSVALKSEPQERRAAGLSSNTASAAEAGSDPAGSAPHPAPAGPDDGGWWNRWGRYGASAVYCFATTYLAATVGLILSELRLPVMLHWMRMPPLEAAGTNVTVSFVAGSTAVLGYILVGNYDTLLLWTFGGTSVLGAVIGANLSARLPEQILKGMISATVAAVGITLFFRAL